MFIWACFPFHSKITVGEGEEIYHSTKDARVMWPKEEKNEWGQKSLTTAAKSCEELGTLNWPYDLRSIILWEMSTADNRGMTMRCICVCVCLCVCVCVCVCLCVCVRVRACGDSAEVRWWSHLGSLCRREIKKGPPHILIIAFRCNYASP